MKTILGLDLGTNSIGWALVKQDFENRQGKILGMGSRIIPMDAAQMGNFDAGNSVSQTAERTSFRGHRRLYERCHLRRERLLRVLNVLEFLPEHFANQIDFEKHFGQFFDETEPKIAWRENQFGKFDFVFIDAFSEMIAEFKESKPELFYTKKNGEETKIPYDWTIYYLRKKALSQKIEKEELAWLILNFNQKRGYYQLRGEEEEKSSIKEFSVLLKIISIEKGEKDKKNDKKTWYKMTFENGWEYSATFLTEPNWLNTEREFLITEEYDEDDNIKTIKDKKSDTTGREKRNITPLPSFDEINLMSKKDQNKIYKKIKARTEITINNSGSTVGTYIYETLLQNPTQKINGKLVRTIERKFYKTELEQILQKQIELQPELFTAEKFNDCIRELYKNNVDHQNELNGKTFVDLLVKDIIFYQRPLRSQKSTIGNCALEFREHKINKKDDEGNPIKNVFEKDKDGNDIVVKEYLKGIPKSHPYYQEFRIWQWLYNLKIYTREDDKDVTTEFIKDIRDLEKLFEFLMSKKEVGNKDVIEFLLEKKLKSDIEFQLEQNYARTKSEELLYKTNIKYKNKLVKEELPKYRWNYVFDNTKEKEEDKSKKYPCNSTAYEIRRRLKDVANVPNNFITKEREYQLWHIIYSVTDKAEFETALTNFANKNNIDESSFVENFKNFKPFKSEYGSFSEKAIKKLLPLIRLGKYWNENEIPESVKERAKSIQERLNNIKDEQTIDNVADDDIPKQILKSFFNKTDFIQGLQLYQASYLVYGRHSEAEVSDKWKMSYDIQEYLYNFRQHSLRNPIVEQVITETLRVVKDIWEQEAVRNNIQPVMVYDEHKKKEVKSYPNILDEIHIELGREMKNTAEDRKAISNSISANETTNLRIKKMLLEFSQDDDFKNEKDFSSYCKDDGNSIFYKQGENPIRPYSPSQFDILKIFEDDVLSKYSEQELKSREQEFQNVGEKEAKNVFEISRKSEPTRAEIIRYKLWLEQKYRSPYTGKMIPLAKLFTPAYEIEHVIPQSRYFDDSYNNIVICEAEVNLLKGNQLGLEFIKSKYGEKVKVGEKTVTIFTETDYKEFVNQHYKNSNKKRKNLLLEEIPDKMIDRQLNDTRYISKFVSGLLSNIVREETNDNGVNSTNLIPVTGAITSKLKQSWGLNDKWNELILPRFERMNLLTGRADFTAKNKEGHTIPAIPFEFSKGFQFKRIDHRHHALDALVIACTTREHIQYLNNENAKSQKIHLQKGLAKKLREFEGVKIKKMVKIDDVWKESENSEIREVPKAYFKPWSNFTIDVKNELEKILVSFKQSSRVINKTVNHYEHYVDGKKIIEKQKKGTNWAIRQPLHEETVSGIVKLPWVEVGKNEVTTANRKALDKSFNLDKIKKITDTSIQQILSNYITQEKFKLVNDKGEVSYNTEIAFSPEGLEGLNKNISQYNNGKFHQPIFKVRIYEKGSGRFKLGTKGNKKDKYVQGAPNLFFALFTNEQQQCKGADRKPTNRCFETIPLNIVIERQKQGLSPVPDTNETGEKLLFHLSPDDLVYIPTEDEQENINTIDFSNLTKEQIQRVFFVNDFSGSTCYFRPNRIAKAIIAKEVDMNYDEKKGKTTGSFDTKTASFEGKQIKETCIKLRVDRLGNISL